MDNISIEVSLTCPTCGCTEFKSEQLEEDEEYTDDWPFTCAHCGKTFTRKELIEANTESIDAAVNDIKDEIVEAAAKELEETFKEWENK